MGALGVLLLTLGLITLTIAKVTGCPPKEIDNFCTCSHGTFKETTGTKVVCRDINNPSTLLKEIQSFREYHVDFLLLLNLQVPYFPAGLFLGTSVKELIIKDSIIENLYSIQNYKTSPFAGLEDSLEEIAIYSTKDPSKWYFPDLSNLKKLKTIEIVQSPIDFVGHVFAEIGGGSLESITVAYSRVYRIHPQAFPELTNIREVNFRGNFLPYMVRTMFPDPAPRLKRIDLSDNKLFTLPENMFDNMPVLEFLDLSQNEFKHFEKPSISSSLTSFYISKNPFVCGCGILPLKQQLLLGGPQYNDLDKVTCKYPGSYEKTFLKDIEEDDISC